MLKSIGDARALTPKKPFATIEQARTWVLSFVTWYNTEHRHSGIRFVTPAQRHYGQEQVIMANRKRVYEAAKRTKPERWKGREIRNWNPIQEVWLNPPSEDSKQVQIVKCAA